MKSTIDQNRVNPMNPTAAILRRLEVGLIRGVELLGLPRLVGPMWPVLALFGVASVVGVGLVAARLAVTGRFGMLYLPWNLFLAWIPLGLALLARRLAGSSRRRSWVLLTGAGWLLFFPNAPYIFTDLMHLAHLRSGSAAPLWFDLLLNLMVAMTGLYLGFASLAVMQDLVSHAWSKAGGWLFAVTALALSGFGVYLGRFLRWNSWDLVRAPLALLADIAACLMQPGSHPRAWGFSALCFVFLLFSYLMCFSLPLLRGCRGEEGAKSEARNVKHET